MNYSLGKFETPYESMIRQIDNFLQGDIIEIKMDGIPEGLESKIHMKLKNEQGSSKVLQVQFWAYHEDMSDDVISAEAVMKINQLIRFLVMRKNVELIADLEESLPGYYSVIRYEEEIDNESGSGESNKLYWGEKLNDIINILLFLISGYKI